ncbi:MAG: hypothetical protein KIT63_23760 [Rhodoferax sp.]|nr:hypothetical protein [Rhodoferax sp.]
MTITELENLASGLTALCNELEAMPSQLQFTDAKIHCSQALALVEDYKLHFRQGKEPFDALLKAAVGEFNTGEKRNIWGELPPSE